MNDVARAGFLRRLGAFAVDLVVVTALGIAVMVVVVVVRVGVLPETASHASALFDAVDTVDPNVLPLVLLAYLVASWTPLLGRRSIGMRLAGIETVRATR